MRRTDDGSLTQVEGKAVLRKQNAPKSMTFPAARSTDFNTASNSTPDQQLGDENSFEGSNHGTQTVGQIRRRISDAGPEKSHLFTEQNARKRVTFPDPQSPDI